MNKQTSTSPRRAMTPAAAERIQSSTAKKSGGGVSPKSFATRAQRAASRKK